MLKETSYASRFRRFKVKWFGERTAWSFVAKGSLLNQNTTIGGYSRINGKLVVRGGGRVSIGRYCAVGSGVRLITQNHDLSPLFINLSLQKELYGRAYINYKDITIEHNVWIGDNVIILPGVHVGHSAVIAAGAVVTKDVAPFDVVGGNPARVLKSRLGEVSCSIYQDQKIFELSPAELKSLLSGGLGDSK